MSWPEVVALGIAVLGVVTLFAIVVLGSGRARRRRSHIDRLVDDFTKPTQFRSKMTLTRSSHTTTVEPEPKSEVKPLITPPPRDRKLEN